MRIGEQHPQQKSLEIYAQELGRTPNDVPIPHNSNVEGPRDEKPPLAFPEQRPKVARMQQTQQQMQARPGYSYLPQAVTQRQREAQISQAQSPPAGPSSIGHPPSTQQRFEQYQRVPQQQAQSGIYSDRGAPKTVTERVDGVAVTGVVDGSPYELVDMPHAPQRLSWVCSFPRPQGSPPEVARLPESKGSAPGRFLDTAESGPRAFEARTIPSQNAVAWDPMREYYSSAGSGDSMISGEEDEMVAGSREIVEMAGLNSFNEIA